MVEGVMVAGWIALAGLMVVWAGLVLSGIRERERRVAWVAAAGGLPVLLAWGIPLVVEFPGRDFVVGAMLGILLVLGIALVVPGRAVVAGRVVGTRSRVDERDALFHRFYRLEPGTADFEAYYREHPGLREPDERIRARPGLGRPGSRAYHPLTSPFQAALFQTMGDLARNLDDPVEPLEGRRVDAPPAELARRLKGLARHLGAGAVGCARLDPANVYSHVARGSGAWGSPIALPHTHAVAIGVEMAHAMVRQAPEGPTLTESAKSYLEAGKIAVVLARTIRLLGYSARAHVDGDYRVLCVPIAVEAGIGELGRLGLLIHPRFGPRIRLSVVTTDMPLEPDRPIAFGAGAFCAICRKCADLCPPSAIPSDGMGEHAGVERWQSLQDPCYRTWRNFGTDCGLCLRVCPFSHPATRLHQAARWLVGRNAFSRRLMLWGENALYGRKLLAPPPPPAWHERKDRHASRDL